MQLVANNLSQLQDNNQYCSVTFIRGTPSAVLRLLLCVNEKFGTQIQKHFKELVGHEMAPALYPILFDQIKALVEKFFIALAGL
jgi:neurofibromin 1